MFQLLTLTEVLLTGPMRFISVSPGQTTIIDSLLHVGQGSSQVQRTGAWP
jgi:hypothetical protein